MEKFTLIYRILLVSIFIVGAISDRLATILGFVIVGVTPVIVALFISTYTNKSVYSEISKKQQFLDLVTVILGVAISGTFLFGYLLMKSIIA